ncbi:hypothetical protein PS15p_204496 [Mucor circinelloides]
MQVKRGHRRLLQRAVANAKGIPSSVPLNITPIVSKELTDTGYSQQQQPQLSQQHKQQQQPPPPLPQHQQQSAPVPPSHSSQQPGKKIMQPAEAMDVSLHALAGASPMNTSSGSSSSATSAAQPEYFPSAGTMIQNQSGMSSTEEEAVTGDNVHRLWKRKYHRHAKPDTNAPLKPPSAYVMFSNDVRAELKQQNKSFTDLAKIIGDRWKNISPEGKEQYETNALRAREDYLKKIEEYQKTESFRKYQQYISDFKAENEAAARPVGRPRKRHRRDGELSDGGTVSESARQGRASSISSQPDDQAQQQTLAQQQQANNNHNRTHSVSSDQRHYPFYLLNEVGLQEQRQQTSPQPLNKQVQQQQQQQRQQQQQQQQTSPRSATTSDCPASTTSGSISSNTSLLTPSSK